MVERLVKGRRKFGVGAVLLVVASLTMSVMTSAGAARSVPGFDGTTITVAGFGIKAQLPKLEEGAQARFKRFNDDNEIKGIKIDMVEFADDGQDPANSLSIARRLVSQTGVFAIVPNGSATTPGDYLTQQQIPWFGGGFDKSYCSSKVSTKLWGFGPSGCIVPQDPSFVNDVFHTMYTYVSEQTGKKHPTFMSFGPETETGKNATRIFAISAQGAGFDVVAQSSNMPLQVSDYLPYAQQILQGDHGKEPDAVFCNGAVQCLPLWTMLQAQGYKGFYYHGLYTDALVKPLNGSYVNHPYPNFDAAAGNSDGFDQMKADIEAINPGAKLDLGDVFGYASADLFVTTLKKVAKKGTDNITQQNVQKAASKQTWSLPGFMKVQYPKSTVMSYPACSANSKSNGTVWEQVEPWSCSTKTYSPKLKVGG